MKAMIWLGLNCGFGCTDCAELKWSDLDRVNGRVKLARGKTGVSRDLPLWPETIQSLENIPKSGSASLNWAAKPGSSIKKIMDGVQMPLADPDYFPGGGNSVTFMTPPGIEGIAGRMAYSSLNNKFSLIWDQATTTEVPQQLAKKMVNLTNWNWPHTFIVPKSVRNCFCRCPWKNGRQMPLS